MPDPAQNEFERAIAGGARHGIVSDIWYFLKTSKKWWLAPILLMLLLLGGLMLLGGTAAAPFIYTLF
jgi:hypothetical protein